MIHLGKRIHQQLCVDFALMEFKKLQLVTSCPGRVIDNLQHMMKPCLLVDVELNHRHVAYRNLELTTDAATSECAFDSRGSLEPCRRWSALQLIRHPHHF